MYQKHGTTVTEGSALGDNGGGHRVVTTDTDTHEETHTEQVPELVASRAGHVVGEGDEEDNTDDGNDQLLAIDELAAEDITEETERDLTDDVTNVGSSVDGTTEQKRVCSL